jgi:glutathione S-transferase
MDALVAERGRRTVPVLRIRGEGGGADRWMPESADIVAYLAERFGGQRAGSASR